MTVEVSEAKLANENGETKDTIKGFYFEKLEYVQNFRQTGVLLGGAR